MTAAAVPLIAEALNLAITEHWTSLQNLRLDHAHAGWKYIGDQGGTYEERYSAGIESLAVALHARLQEQGALG